MTIKDLEPQISEGLSAAGVDPNTYLDMTIPIKDGGDITGEVKRKNETFNA